jgi:hypothetical protein
MGFWAHENSKGELFPHVGRILSAIVLFCVTVVVVLMIALPQYGVWQKELRGKAMLREAEWQKRVLVEDAQAKMDAASLLASAEVERARGVAEANEIIGMSLRENEAYLRYLWINGLHDGSSEIIYVPTEANLPILEATRGLLSR